MFYFIIPIVIKFLKRQNEIHIFKWYKSNSSLNILTTVKLSEIEVFGSVQCNLPLIK